MIKKASPTYVLALIRTSDEELIKKVNKIKDKIKITHEEIYKRGVLAVENEMKERRINS